MITSRNFNKIILASFELIRCPKILYAQNYSYTINWLGGSFLTGASDIDKDFPLTKPASEIIMNENNATFLNSYLIKTLKDTPLNKVNLELGGYSDDAQFALTFSIAAGFVFGKVDIFFLSQYLGLLCITH